MTTSNKIRKIKIKDLLAIVLYVWAITLMIANDAVKKPTALLENSAWWILGIASLYAMWWSVETMRIHDGSDRSWWGYFLKGKK